MRESARLVPASCPGCALGLWVRPTAPAYRSGAILKILRVMSQLKSSVPYAAGHWLGCGSSSAGREPPEAHVTGCMKSVPAVVRNFEAHAAAPKAVSVVTYGELIYGAVKSARPLKNLARVRRLAEILPVLDVSRAVMDTVGSLKAEGEKRGRRIDDFDWIIAATALVRGFAVVTNNEKRFVGVPGLRVENWSRG